MLEILLITTDIIRTLNSTSTVRTWYQTSYLFLWLNFMNSREILEEVGTDSEGTLDSDAELDMDSDVELDEYLNMNK